MQVSISDRHRPRKKQKTNKKGKGREWVLRKKEQMRKRGTLCPKTQSTQLENGRLAFDGYDITSKTH